MLDSGADILDLGACSTRPGSDSISGEEEWSRLEPALRILAAEHPGVRISIDTFRPEVVSKAFDIIGPFVVNDVSGGCGEMWKLLGQLGLPYIAMHTRGTPKNMQSLTDYDNVTEAVREFSRGSPPRRTGMGSGTGSWIPVSVSPRRRSRTGSCCVRCPCSRSSVRRFLWVSPARAFCSDLWASRRPMSCRLRRWRISSRCRTGQTFSASMMSPRLSVQSSCTASFTESSNRRIAAPDMPRCLSMREG